MKKIGIFFATILPMLLSIGFQFLSISMLLGIEALLLLFTGQADPIDRVYGMLHDTDFTMMLSVEFAILNIIVFGAWYYYRYEADYMPRLRTTFHPSIFASLALFAPAAQFLAGLIVMLIAALSPSTLSEYEELIERAGLNDNTSVLMLVYAILLGPLGEELLFRGVTLRSARRIFPFWAANLMQAVLFGIFHMNIIQGAYACALGLLLGAICEKLGSIYYSIFLHMSFNLWGTVISGMLGDTESIPVIILYYFGILLAATASVLLFRYGISALRRQRTAEFAASSRSDID